jgi:hypothetical protein
MLECFTMTNNHTTGTNNRQESRNALLENLALYHGVCMRTTMHRNAVPSLSPRRHWTITETLRLLRS